MSVLGELADENMLTKDPLQGYILCRTLPTLRACSLCGKMKHSLYEVPIEETTFLFCSIQEAKIGIDNYKKNKAKGLTNIVTPGVPAQPTITDN